MTITNMVYESILGGIAGGVASTITVFMLQQIEKISKCIIIDATFRHETIC